jgi:germination protein M
MRISLGRLPRRVCFAGLVMLVVAAVLVVTAGCGVSDEVGDGGTVSTTASSQTTATEPSGDTTTTVPSNTSTTFAGDALTVNVYFSKGEKVCAAARVIPKTQEVGAAAMKALLEGPTAAEADAGMVSNIPDGTTFLGLQVENGVATVDLSKEYASGGGSLSMFMRLAEVVFTLTQFPTVEGVNFKLDGEAIDVLGGEGIIIDRPQSRADYEDMSPAILVESPTLGNTVGSPLRVTGTANVFEAVFAIDLVNWDGLIIAEKTVMATSGTGTRGTFDVTIPFALDRAGTGAIIVYYNSPKDGSRVVVDEIQIWLQ